jgi:DNA-binding response OmpR family regulator
MPASIFIIDSSPAVRRMVEQISSPQGHEVIGFQDGPAALEAARRITPDLIIVDYHLVKMTFSGFCKEVAKLNSLAETVLVCLVDAADRLDEQHLRMLGVQACLKKPLQQEHLLDAVKQLKQRSAHQTAPATSLKKRAWPPDSTATDTEEKTAASMDTEQDSAAEADNPVHEESPMTSSTPIPSTGTTPDETAENTPRSNGAAAADEAMRGFLAHLLQSVVQQAEQKVSELIPPVVAKELTLQLSKAVQQEVRDQITAALSADRIEAAIGAALQNELPKQAASQLAVLENTVKQHVGEVAAPLVEQTSEKLIREMTAAGLVNHVPQAVREHLGPVEMVIKEEVRQAVSRYAQQITEDIVQEAAPELIQKAVHLIVPDVAEARIKEEIARLTAPE